MSEFSGRLDGLGQFSHSIGPGEENVEAAIGFEPMHRGFADLSLTTWVRRLRDGWPLGRGINYHARTDASIEAQLLALRSGIFRCG